MEEFYIRIVCICIEELASIAPILQLPASHTQIYHATVDGATEHGLQSQVQTIAPVKSTIAFYGIRCSRF